MNEEIKAVCIYGSLIKRGYIVRYAKNRWVAHEPEHLPSPLQSPPYESVAEIDAWATGCEQTRSALGEK